MTGARFALTTHAPRHAALEFMAGVSEGWNLWAFLSWYQKSMLGPGRIRHVGPATRVVVREPGIGAFELTQDFWKLPLRPRLEVMTRAFLALVSAHTRVLHTLRRHVSTHSIEFVQAACHAGRVARPLPAPGRDPNWDVSLEPADALSDWILALFAADYLNHPTDYLHGLCVCRVCGKARFEQGPKFRTLCDRHATEWLLRHGLAFDEDEPPTLPRANPSSDYAAWRPA